MWGLFVHQFNDHTVRSFEKNFIFSYIVNPIILEHVFIKGKNPSVVYLLILRFAM